MIRPATEPRHPPMILQKRGHANVLHVLYCDAAQAIRQAHQDIDR